MSGRVRILAIPCAAALAALLAGFSFGQANQDPCGGHYAGEGLRATFLSQYTALSVDKNDPNYGTPILWLSNITNGNASSYQYVVPGGDCVFLYRNGHVIVGVGWPLEWPDINHDRFVNMRVVLKDPSGCTPAPFMDGSVIQPSSIQFWTGNGFTPSRKPDGKLLLTGTNALLNFGTLTPGKTYYCQLMVRFTVPGYGDEFRFDTQVKVYYGPFDLGGFGWEITPIHEDYEIQLMTKVGKKLVPSGDPTPHESSVYHQDLGSNLGCTYGQIVFPFKLILERL